MAFPTGWNRTCALTIDHTKVPSSLSNFPVLLGYNTTVDNATNLPTEMLVSSGANAANSDGSDIRFSSDSAGASPLHCEVVSFTQHATTDASRHAEIWVACNPSSSTDTVIYVWYNNAGATAPAANDATFGSQGVWDSDYIIVEHLANGTTLSVADSTANANNGTNVGTATASTGVIGGGAGLSGSAQYITNNGALLASNTTNYTISAWAVSTSTGGGSFNIFSSGTSAAYSIQLRRDGADLNLYQKDGPHDINARQTNGIVANTWKYIVGSWDGSNIHLYADGSLIASTASTTHDTNGTQNGWGVDMSDGGPFQYWGGQLDECRLSKVARSANWITAEYNNQHSPSTFVTVGTPSSPSGSTGNASGSIPSISVSAPTASATGIGAASGALPTVTISAPTAVGGAVGEASGALTTITLSAPTSTATGAANASAALPTVTLSAPTATAGGVGAASGSLPTVTISAPTASATGIGAASAALPTVTLSAPTASATGAANTTGALPTITLGAPTATASGSGVGTAVGALPTITLSAPTATAVGAANAASALPTIVISHPSATAGSATEATGALPTLTVSAPTATATGAAMAAGASIVVTISAPTATASGTTPTLPCLENEIVKALGMEHRALSSGLPAALLRDSLLGGFRR